MFRLVRRQLFEITQVPLPSLSPTMDEGTIISWEIEEGQAFEAGDLLAIVETDKASVDFEADEDGILAKIIVPAGGPGVPVGGIVAIVCEEESELAEAKKMEITSAVPAAAAPSPTSAAPSPGPSASPVSATPVQSVDKSGRLKASPFARHLAAEAGVQLNSVSPTGPAGRIVADDVIQAAKAPAPVAATFQASNIPFIDIPNNNIRKVTARRLVESKQTIPHYYLQRDVDMSELLKLRSYLNSTAPIDTSNPEKPRPMFKLSVNDFILKASAAALREVPAVNSQWSTEAIRRFSDVNISVAVQGPSGLTTPVLRDVHSLGLMDISSGVKDLAFRARDGKLTPEEFIDGTFTVSNLGMFGISSFCAIINPPQAAILAVGTSVDTVKPNGFDDDGNQIFKVQPTMSATLSCDHRVIDGAVGAEWLQSFASYMEKPTKLLL